MNQKKTYKSDWKPDFLYEVTVSSTGKNYTLAKGMWVSVARRPGLIAGKYEFLYGERTLDGTLLLQVSGPISRERRVKTIRESDIKTVHLKTKGA